MNYPRIVRIENMVTRFIYPFYYMKNRTSEVASVLAGTRTPSGPQGQSAWQLKHLDEVHELYRQELHQNVAGYLFAEADRADYGHQDYRCRYLRLADSYMERWFGGRSIDVLHPRSRDTIFSIRIYKRAGIEMFLSPHGVGMLSLAFEIDTPDECNVGDQQDLDRLKEFNYRLSQLGRSYSMPLLRVPHALDRPRDDIDSEHAKPIPDGDAALEERLGKPGGTYTLREICDSLTGPLAEKYDLKPFQNQFSVYSILRFGDGVDFGASDKDNPLASLLAGLAQVEEPSHAGSMIGAEHDIVDLVLNSKHWAAASCLGAAHIVADQGVEFDNQRMHQIAIKYFVPYLAAMLQRLTYQRIIDDGAALVRLGDRQRKSGFNVLHSELLSLTVNGHFTDVSLRDALNRWYRVSQKGLNVHAAAELVGRAISSNQSDAIVDELAKNVGTISHVQNNLEWIEIFFISFYATELTHIFSVEFGHDFGRISVILAPVVAGAAATIMLKPWRVGQHRTSRRERIWLYFAAIVIPFLIWLYFGLQSGGSATHERQTGHAGEGATSTLLGEEPEAQVDLLPSSPTSIAPDTSQRGQHLSESSAGSLPVDTE